MRFIDHHRAGDGRLEVEGAEGDAEGHDAPGALGHRDGDGLIVAENGPDGCPPGMNGLT